MATIQVLEHQRLRVVDVRLPNETAITVQEASELERLMPKLPRGVCRWEHQAVRFSQHCGVICLGKTVLEVLPKIAGKEVHANTCRDVLVGMLSESRLIEPATSGKGSVQLQKKFLLDAFVLDFCRDLEAQVVQGLLRHYVGRLDNLSVIRGKLLWGLQLKHNVAHKERLYCEYDELSPDILLNQVIKGVLRALVRLPLGTHAANFVRELLLRFTDVSDVIPTASMLDQVTLDRTTRRFAPIVEQCRWFVEGIYPDVTAGGADAAALLFDMNKLFEACVTRAARREAWKRGLRLRAHGPRKWLAHEVESGRDMFALKPDITITDADGSMLLVADAKWKVLNEDDANFGVAEADLYQLVAYASRYGVCRAALIYPKNHAFARGRCIRVYSPSVSVQLIPFDVSERTLNFTDLVS